MGLVVGLNLFRTQAGDSFGRIRSTGNKMRVKNLKTPARNQQKTHLNIYVSALRKFVEIEGIPYLSDSDLEISHVEAKGWESANQCPRKQAGRIPVSVLEARATCVSDSSRGLPERLSAWSSMVEVAACLRLGDLLNTAPATTVLMNEDLLGFSAKTKTRGKV